MPLNSKLPSVRRRTWGTVGCALSALALQACELPTESPIIEQHWNVPSDSSTMSVGSLLPDAVTVDGEVFVVDVADPAAETRTLYQDCATCAAADGTTIPKPAFTATSVTTSEMPAGLTSAPLETGAVNIVLRNQYAFDPIRPAPGVTGTITVQVTNGATLLGTSTIDGTTIALPAGGALNIAVGLNGTVDASSPITVTVEVDSPEGDPAGMTAEQHIVVTPAIVGVTTRSATIEVVNRVVETVSELDLSDLDESFAEKVDSAAIRLSLTNPFPVSGTLTLSLEPVGGTPVTRTITLAPNAVNLGQAVRFAAHEIRPLFGAASTLRISGPVSASAPVTVTPGQLVSIGSRLDLFLALGR